MAGHPLHSPGISINYIGTPSALALRLAACPIYSIPIEGKCFDNSSLDAGDGTSLALTLSGIPAQRKAIMKKAYSLYLHNFLLPVKQSSVLSILHYNI